MKNFMSREAGEGSEVGSELAETQLHSPALRCLRILRETNSEPGSSMKPDVPLTFGRQVEIPYATAALTNAAMSSRSVIVSAACWATGLIFRQVFFMISTNFSAG